MRLNLIRQLSYLAGAWQGDGFVVHFTAPTYSMMFGSMQVSDGAGGTAYWETYRFEEKNGALLLYPGQMGRESGSYVLKKPASERPEPPFEHAFDAFINAHPAIRQIVFASDEPGVKLAMKVRVQSPEGPAEKVFHMGRSG